MDVSERSSSGSALFFSDVTFTEVLGSLDGTAVVIINY